MFITIIYYYFDTFMVIKSYHLVVIPSNALAVRVLQLLVLLLLRVVLQAPSTTAPNTKYYQY